MTKEFLMGHGVANTFGGLPTEYTDLAKSKVVILPVPFDKTTSYQHGSDAGPAALIEASRSLELYDVETEKEVYEVGIHTAAPVKAESSATMLETTERRVAEFLKQDKFVVTLGGEHSISAAPIRACAQHFGKISVLQFDAHGDLQPAYEGNPLSHASVMARVREIPNVTRSVAVGIRSLGPDELPLLDRQATFFAHTIHIDNAWMDRAIELLSPKVYITFDLDVFDSSVMPSTGTPEPGGMAWYQALTLLRRVCAEREVIGCDIVELLPNPQNIAPDFLAAKLLYKILSYRF
jgi:agmatinase